MTNKDTNTRESGAAETAEQKMKALRELVSSFDTGMLVTRSEEGGLRARPMQIVAQQAGGKLVFVTHIDDTKIDEVLASPGVNVTLQDGSRYVSVTGTASVDNDRGRIGLYHNKSWDVWFPEGVSDPNIALIDVDPSVAEFWDGSGVHKLRYALAAAKAVLNKEAIEQQDVIDHETVRLDGSAR